MGRGYAHFTIRKQAQRGQVGRPGFNSCQFDSKAVYLSRILKKKKKKNIGSKYDNNEDNNIVSATNVSGFKISSS